MHAQDFWYILVTLWFQGAMKVTKYSACWVIITQRLNYCSLVYMVLVKSQHMHEKQQDFVHASACKVFTSNLCSTLCEVSLQASKITGREAEKLRKSLKTPVKFGVHGGKFRPASIFT